MPTPTSQAAAASVLVKCPVCGHQITLGPSAIQQVRDGMKVPCPGCGQLLSIKLS